LGGNNGVLIIQSASIQVHPVHPIVLQVQPRMRLIILDKMVIKLINLLSQLCISDVVEWPLKSISILSFDRMHRMLNACLRALLCVYKLSRLEGLKAWMISMPMLSVESI
jgi:hypothetical protein